MSMKPVGLSPQPDLRTTSPTKTSCG